MDKAIDMKFMKIKFANYYAHRARVACQRAGLSRRLGEEWHHWIFCALTTPNVVRAFRIVTEFETFITSI